MYVWPQLGLRLDPHLCNKGSGVYVGIMYVSG